MKRKKSNIEKVVIKEVFTERDEKIKTPREIPHLYPSNQMEDGIIPRAKWDDGLYK